MLARGTSNASARLRRAKSNTSAKVRSAARDIEHIDPEIARYHALAAANVAFNRDGRVARASSDSSHPIMDHVDLTGVDQDNKPLQRRQSIRFTGPTAEPIRHYSITRRTAPAYADSSARAKDQRPDLKRNGSVTQEHNMTALPQVESAPSTPSSYRKLKKSRSMFSPRGGSPLVFANATPRSIERQRHRLSRLSSEDERRAAETGSSGNYTSPTQIPNSQANNPYRKSYDQDAAIQIARDQYLRQLEQQRPKARPSVLSIRHRGAQKAFRRSVRTSSTNSYGPAIGSVLGLPSAKKKSLGNKARNLSVTLKNKMKSVFFRNESLQDTMPIQHVEAQGVHFSGNLSATSGVEHQGPLPPAPDRALLFRVRSRSSSIQRMPVHLERTASPTSIRSAHSNSLCTSRSRITSWTNSTAANTLSKQHLQEKKRLSVIQENGGPHQPSSSAGLMGVAARKSYAIFQKPLRGTTENERMVDSHRIFSALQKRLDEHNRLPDRQDSQPSTSRHTSNESLSRDSVEEQAESPCVDRTILGGRDDDLFRAQMITSARSMNFTTVPASGVKTGDLLRSPSAASITRKPVNTAGEASEGPTYQQIANRNEGLGRAEKKPLRDVKSAFFPSTLYYQPRIPSPYRRAIQSSGEEKEHSNINGNSADSMGGGIHVGAVVMSPMEGSITSGSVYSGSHSVTPQPQEISLSHVDLESTWEHGTATIVEPASFDLRNNASSEQHKPSSASSSGEWRGWMASEVQNLEGKSNYNSMSPNIGKTNKFKHQRENAQINSDDVLLRGRPRRSSAHKQPLAAIHANSLSRPVLRHRSSGQSAEKVPLRYPMVDRARPPGRTTSSIGAKAGAHMPDSHGKALDPTRTPYSAPNINFKQGSLRSQASEPFLTSDASYDKGIKGLKENVNANVSPRADLLSGVPNQHFGNHTSRYSPERAERLRRMQRSNAMKSKENMRAFIHGVHKRGHQQENQAVNDLTPTSTSREDRATKDSEALGTITVGKQVNGSQNMVDLFLRNYRTASPMEEAVSPAFI